MSSFKWQETISLNINDKIEYIVNVDDKISILIESKCVETSKKEMNACFMASYHYDVRLHRYNSTSRKVIALSNEYISFNKKFSELYYDNSNNSIYFLFERLSLLTKYNLNSNKWEYINKELKNNDSFSPVCPCCLYGNNDKLYMIDYDGNYYIHDELNNKCRNIQTKNTIKDLVNRKTMLFLDHLIYNSKYNIVIMCSSKMIFSFSPETMEWKLLFEGNDNIRFMDWIQSTKLITGINNDYAIGYQFSSNNNSLVYMCYNIKQNSVDVFKIKYPHKLISLHCFDENRYYINLLIHGFIGNIGINIIRPICDIIIAMYDKEYIAFINETDDGISINKCTWNQFISQTKIYN